MMHPGETMVALGAFTALALSVKFITSAIIRWQENKLKYTASTIDRATEARLERMEHAVDAIAIEIERISEGQRFTTKLLSQQQRMPAHTA